MKIKLIFTTLLLTLCATTFSHSTCPPKKKPSPWAGTKVSGGLTLNTGNKSNSDTNLDILLNWAKAPWKNSTDINFQYSKSAGTETKDQMLFQEQLQHSFNKNKKIKNYGYSNLTYQTNKFAAYEKQISFTLGYGRDWNWIKNKKITISTQLGPTYRLTVSQQTSQQEDKNFAGTVTANLKYQYTKSTSLTEQISYTIGPPTNHLLSITSLTSKLNGKLSLSINYNVENWAEIPAGLTGNTNTSTTANLVYSL
jgi:putative salt-induced outer membrane protein